MITAVLPSTLHRNIIHEIDYTPYVTYHMSHASPHLSSFTRDISSLGAMRQETSKIPELLAYRRVRFWVDFAQSPGAQLWGVRMANKNAGSTAFWHQKGAIIFETIL